MEIAKLLIISLKKGMKIDNTNDILVKSSSILVKKKLYWDRIFKFQS